MGEIINIDKEKLKKKWWEFKHDAEIKIRSGIEWAKEHKEFCAAAVPVAYGVIREGISFFKKTKQEKLLEEQRQRIWDPRKGRFSYYRREPNRKEWEYIDREYEKGRSYREILEDLGLLK